MAPGPGVFTFPGTTQAARGERRQVDPEQATPHTSERLSFLSRNGQTFINQTSAHLKAPGRKQPSHQVESGDSHSVLHFWSRGCSHAEAGERPCQSAASEESEGGGFTGETGEMFPLRSFAVSVHPLHALATVPHEVIPRQGPSPHSSCLSEMSVCFLFVPPQVKSGIRGVPGADIPKKAEK